MNQTLKWTTKRGERNQREEMRREETHTQRERERERDSFDAVIQVHFIAFVGDWTESNRIESNPFPCPSRAEPRCLTDDFPPSIIWSYRGHFISIRNVRSPSISGGCLPTEILFLLSNWYSPHLLPIDSHSHSNLLPTRLDQSSISTSHSTMCRTNTRSAISDHGII